MKIKLLFLLLFLFLMTQLNAQINILDLGAKPDGKTLNTTIIQKAIYSCAAKNGGTVLIPKGQFLTGTIELKTGVTLQITESAGLLPKNAKPHKRPDVLSKI